MPITYLDEKPKSKITYLDELITPEVRESPSRTFYREAISPLFSGVSTFALGLPKETAKMTGAKETMYPEQKTLPGKILRAGAEIGGFALGAPLKAGQLLAKGATRLIPSLAGRGTLKAATRLGIEGAGAGLALTPEEGKGIFKPIERLKQAGIFGATGAALPIVGAGLRLPLKAGKWTSKNIGGITEATDETIKRLGSKRVFSPEYGKADYITQDLAPKIESMYKDSIAKFTPEIQTYAKEKLGIPESAISTIKKKGTQIINQTRQALGDSTDTISQRINEGFSLKNKTANDAYAKAISNFKGNTIDSAELYQTIQKGLRDKGWVDLSGNPTTRYKSGLDPVVDKLTDMYLDMKTPLTNRGIRTIGKIISKEDFSTYRDALGSMLREKPSDRLVMSARNSLYNSAEKSGMKGLKEARNMEYRVFETERRFLDSQGNLKALGKEKTLDNFHKLTQDQIRQLREIENYTGVKFIDDLDTLTASRYLDSFSKLDVEKIAKDMIRARDPNWTEYVSGEYSKLLGKEKFNAINDDLMAHFANIDFGLTTRTPGAGGGIYPSRSGLLRAGVAGTSKQYYKMFNKNPTSKMTVPFKTIPTP